LAVRVRLTRVGSKKNPIWRVVVADGRSPRDGRCIETIGHYNPQTQPSRIEIDRERLQHWLDRGAQPTNTVKKLMRAENTGFEMPKAEAPAPAPRRPAEEEAPAEPEVVAEPAAEDEAGEGGPGEEPPAEAPQGESSGPEVVADESEATAEADENP
jgi:small subunit ribosomal protein S16